MAMTATPFEYWTPGSEERQLRVFISHRYGKDQSLYDDVISAITRNGFSVQDISLSANHLMAGPRGGHLPTLDIQAEVAARIYTSDIVIAPSRPGVSRSEWVTWEVQLAAIGYGIPILFVNQKGQQRRTSLVTQIDALGLPYRACDPDTDKIARNVAELVDARPTWAIRHEETDEHIRFRGPPAHARNAVLRKLPFRPRLNAPEPEPERLPRRSIWSLLSGKDQHA